jgi:hypothetical protein
MIVTAGLWALAGSAMAQVLLDEVDFYYRTDAEARYQSLRTQWRQTHAEVLTAEEAEPLALQAFNAASIAKPLPAWRQQGGPRPWVFFAQAHLVNPTPTARLNVPITAKLEARIGPLRVDPRVLMTDYGYLEKNARWQPLSTQTFTVPVLAPGEEILAPVGKVQILRLLRFNPTAWPVALRLTVSTPGQPPKQRLLPLIPDHFVLPEAYRY